MNRGRCERTNAAESGESRRPTRMTTTKQTVSEVSKRSGISAKLIRAVLAQLGGGEDAESSLEDIARHGVDGGFTGFCYHSETVLFFKQNRVEIVTLTLQMAEGLDENVAEMVAGFGCLAGHESRDDYDYNGQPKAARRKAIAEHLPSVSRCLYGGRLTNSDTQAANALAWFAAEEVARAWVND